MIHYKAVSMANPSDIGPVNALTRSGWVLVLVVPLPDGTAVAYMKNVGKS